MFQNSYIYAREDPYSIWEKEQQCLLFGTFTDSLSNYVWRRSFLFARLLYFFIRDGCSLHQRSNPRYHGWHCHTVLCSDHSTTLIMVVSTPTPIVVGYWARMEILYLKVTWFWVIDMWIFFNMDLHFSNPKVTWFKVEDRCMWRMPDGLELKSEE